MLSVNMFSKADTVKGQGVLSAYNEQVDLLKTQVPEIAVYENSSKKCDIVHFHTINFKYFCMMPFLKKDAKTVAYVHFLPETLDNSISLSKPIKKIFYKYVISFYNNVDRLVVVNPYFIERLSKYGIDKNRVTYIPNFVSKENFYKKDNMQKKRIREKYGFKENDFIVVGVGQLQTRKGVLDFIEVAKNIPEVKFIWAGGAVFGKITDGYEKIQSVIKNKLPKNVRFLGLVDREKMNDIYNMSDVMFLPSYEELFPMSILEAMCVGLPVITRDVELYKNILFDYYISGINNNDFENLILKLKTDSNFYMECCNKSLKCNAFYSKDNISNMWRNFYIDTSKIETNPKLFHNLNFFN